MNPQLGSAILRVVLGVIFVTHGAPKLFGGMEGTAAFLESLQIPVPLVTAWLLTLLEFAGGLALIVGLYVSPISFFLSLHMLLGIILVHADKGWYVLDRGTGGVEFNLLLIAGLLMLMLGGPGLASLDVKRRR